MSHQKWVKDTVVDVSTVKDLTSVDKVTTISANGNLSFTYVYDPILPTRQQLNENVDSSFKSAVDALKSRISEQSFSMPSDINSMTAESNDIDLSILKRSFLPQSVTNQENYHQPWTFLSLLTDTKEEYQNLTNP